MVANPAACAMLRMRTGMAYGVAILPFFEIPQQSEMNSQFAELLRRERLSIQFEGRLIRRSGESFSARLSAALITDFDFGETGCFVTVEDLDG